MSFGSANEKTNTAKIRATTKKTPTNKEIPPLNTKTIIEHSLHFSFKVATFMLKPEKQTQNQTLN